MIIVNGYFRTVTRQGGGFRDGMPVPVTEALSERSTYCNIKVAGREYNSKTETQTAYTYARYELLIDDFNFNAEYIELKDIRGKALGRCKVDNIEPLDSVNAVRITATRYADNQSW